jgi:hypothetical protein
MAFFTPPPLPPPQAPTAEIRSAAPTVAHAVAENFLLQSKDRLAPAEQALNLLAAANQRLQIDPIRTKLNKPDRTITYSLGESLFFQITVLGPQELREFSEPISIIGYPNVLKAIKQTLRVGDEVNSKGRLRAVGGAQEILLTPKQFASLYEQMDTFIKTLETLEGPSTHRSEAPLPLQEGQPPILALWNLDGNSRS